MADNYIEKQYEQYQARKAAWNSSGKHTIRKKLNSQLRIFITGGASGIGKSLVEAFSKAGWRTAFCDINDAEGRRIAAKTGTTFLKCDVCNADELKKCMNQLFDAWGDIDAIINNAGVGNFKPITETSVDDFDHIIQTNLRPVFITSKLLAEHRKGLSDLNPFGRIINIGSTRYLMSDPHSEGYAASKGGIYALTHALALSLSEWNITVNCIAPGWIETGDYDAIKIEDHEQHPSKRVGKPEDIARMCLFLCQKENDFINGETIVIDGGDRKSVG